MKKIILSLVLVTIIGAVPISCGTRNVKGRIENYKSSTSVQDSGSVKTEQTEQKTDSSDKQVNTNKTDEKQDYRIRELFYENGTLKERISELLSSKSTDLSTERERRTITTYTMMVSHIQYRHFKNIDITTRVKVKETESKRNGLYWLIGVGVLGGIVLGRIKF